MLRRSRLTAVAAGLLAAAFALSGSAHAQPIRVEAENFIPPNAVSTMGSGPNSTNIVTVDANSAASPDRRQRD